MSLPEIVSREQWIGDRRALLKREKALTKARDELAAERRRLPMVAVTADYRFTAADGSSRTLLDLFEGRRQLIVDHYMFDPDWDDGCMSCAGRVDQYGNTDHLHGRDTTIAVVSRAPIAKIERWNPCLPTRRRSRLPHLLNLRTRHRADGRHALLPRHDRPGPPG
jgi:predicted dithiol-disulfide oxidoreductase (DUF899 family)